MKKVISPFFNDQVLISVLNRKVSCALSIFIICSVFIPFSFFVSAKTSSSPSISEYNVVLECVCRDDTVDFDPYAAQTDIVFGIMEVKGINTEEAMKTAQELCTSYKGNILNCIDVSVEVECSCSEINEGELYTERFVGTGANKTQALKDIRLSCDEAVGEKAFISQCIDL